MPSPVTSGVCFGALLCGISQLTHFTWLPETPANSPSPHSHPVSNSEGKGQQMSGGGDRSVQGHSYWGGTNIWRGKQASSCVSQVAVRCRAGRTGELCRNCYAD